MKLSSAAKAFDKTPCYDAYTGVLAFNGQLGLFDDKSGDGDSEGRRVLSTAGSSVMTTRRVITLSGAPFIVGRRHVDLFNKSLTRATYVIQDAPELAYVYTLGELCLDQPGFSAYAGRGWLKNLADVEQNSKLTQQYNIHFAVNEAVREGLIVSFAARYYMVRVTNVGGGGTLVCTCDQLPEPVIETGTLTTGTFNPVTELLSGLPTPVRVARLRWQSLFEYHGQQAPRMAPGDIQVAIAWIEVKPGARLELSDGAWYIASADLVDGAYVCRATRHAGY